MRSWQESSCPGNKLVRLLPDGSHGGVLLVQGLEDARQGGSWWQGRTAGDRNAVERGC